MMKSVLRSAGFTLMEMLVVLAITSMVVGLLMQGLYQVFRINERFGAEIVHTQREAMRVDWYRTSLQGLIPDQKDGKYKFAGAMRELKGLTLTPLNAAGGGLAPLLWKLDYDSAEDRTVLRYDEIAVFDWPGNSGRFRYVDGEGRPHDRWPPPLGAAPQLPQSIWLEYGAGNAANIIIAAPQGPTEPPVSRLMQQKDI